MEVAVQAKHGLVNKKATVENALDIYCGSWHQAVDGKTVGEVSRLYQSDPRPSWCAEEFGSLENKRVLELGPGEGYNTLALDRLGAQVDAVEGATHAFLRCLIVKNAFNMRARFLLGDFEKYMKDGGTYDLLYASGILYHLNDPIEFLKTARSISSRLFLWTHFYSEEHVALIPDEAAAFATGRTETKKLAKQSFTYHVREYNQDFVAKEVYIGCLDTHSRWMDRDDLFRALDAVGYDVKRVVEDPFDGSKMPAVSILAEAKS